MGIGSFYEDEITKIPSRFNYLLTENINLLIANSKKSCLTNNMIIMSEILKRVVAILFTKFYLFKRYHMFRILFAIADYRTTVRLYHGLRTPNEGINQRYLKKLADVADKLCCRHT